MEVKNHPEQESIYSPSDVYKCSLGKEVPWKEILN